MKHEIEIPDLPEGWEADTLTFDKRQIEAMASCLTHEETTCTLSCRVLIRKKQPRRIVLQESGNIRVSCYLLEIDEGNLILPPGREYKIVEDNKCAE